MLSATQWLNLNIKKFTVRSEAVKACAKATGLHPSNVRRALVLIEKNPNWNNKWLDARYTYKPSDDYVAMKSQEKTSKEKSKEYAFAKELIDQGIDINQVKAIIKSAQGGSISYKKDYNIGKNNVTFGIISDTHIGNINYNPNFMDAAAAEFKKKNVDFVCHAGDITDGLYINRPGQVYELNAIGADAQVNMAVKELSKLKKPLIFITGNHEGNTYFKQVGHDIGPRIETELKVLGMEVTYLGRDRGIIKLKGGATIMLSHPCNGSSYAISYKTQKKLDSLYGGDKPSVLIVGHYHKAEYIFYRNVHALQAGTLEMQSEFMVNMDLAAMTGYWVVNMTTNDKGEVTSFSPTFYPFYK
jgi:predicted phosphodiesterase